MADNVEWVNALVQEDRKITVTSTADKLDSCESTYSFMYENFRYHKM
jgi:hypothetical protein